MDSMLDYYRKYFQAGGDYTMQATGGSSRVLTLLDWITHQVPKGSSILDVGCGDMFLSTQVDGYKWTGIDVNTEKAKGRAVAHDLMQTPYPFASGSFDAVVCSEVLEHLWDMRPVHAEIYRLLKPGGKYLMSTPNFSWIENTLSNYQLITFDPARPWTMEHIRHYTPAIHEKYLTEAGFKIQDYTGADAHFGALFETPTKVLTHLLHKQLKLEQFNNVGAVHQVLGRMFPTLSHTIMFFCEKEAK